MKEKDFLRRVSDRQMPDLEKIRENIISGKAEEENKKILHLKPSRLIAVAAVVAFALIGTIAAVASAGGGFFFNPQPESVATADEVDYKEHSADVKQNKSKTSSKAKNKKLPHKDTLKDSGFETSWAEPLGSVGEYELVYAGGDYSENCSCDYIIDDFTFSCTEQLSPYGLGLYIVKGNTSYNLTEARKKNIITDISDVVRLIDNKNGEIDFNFTIHQNNYFAKNIKGRIDRNVATFTRLGTVDGLDLYYNLRSNEGTEPVSETFGNLKITTNKPKRDYSLGIYAADSSRLGSLSEAFENGWITDMNLVKELIKSNRKAKNRFSFEILEEEITEPATEEETQEAADNENTEETLADNEQETTVDTEE